MRYKILFAEDELILGKLVKESLEKAEYDVKLVTNGLEVLQAYRDEKPHICLLDIMLPGRNGYEIAQQLRNLDKKMPIIFLTAKVQVSDLVAGFNAGCNDYVRKPFSMDELLLRVRSWLAERYGGDELSEATHCVIGNYRLDVQQQILETTKGNVQLTYKETAVLRLLYQHRNNITGREDIMQKVWGNDTSYQSRTLDVYINRLRKYLGGSGTSIVTLKGIGYRFIVNNK